MHLLAQRLELGSGGCRQGQRAWQTNSALGLLLRHGCKGSASRRASRQRRLALHYTAPRLAHTSTPCCSHRLKQPPQPAGEPPPASPAAAPESGRRWRRCERVEREGDGAQHQAACTHYAATFYMSPPSTRAACKPQNPSPLQCSSLGNHEGNLLVALALDGGPRLLAHLRGRE